MLKKVLVPEIQELIADILCNLPAFEVKARSDVHDRIARRTAASRTQQPGIRTIVQKAEPQKILSLIEIFIVRNPSFVDYFCDQL